MFLPVVLSTCDDDLSQVSFMFFIKYLKKTLRDRYRDAFDQEATAMNTKRLMKKLRNSTVFSGEILKFNSSFSLTPADAGKMIADITWIVYSILCTLRREFYIGRKLKDIAGIIQDCPLESADDRIMYALFVLHGISKSHDIFAALGIRKNIQTLFDYFRIVVEE